MVKLKYVQTSDAIVCDFHQTGKFRLWHGNFRTGGRVPPRKFCCATLSRSTEWIRAIKGNNRRVAQKWFWISMTLNFHDLNLQISLNITCFSKVKDLETALHWQLLDWIKQICLAHVVAASLLWRFHVEWRTKTHAKQKGLLRNPSWVAVLAWENFLERVLRKEFRHLCRSTKLKIWHPKQESNNLDYMYMVFLFHQII